MKTFSIFHARKTGYFDRFISYSIEDSLIRYRDIIAFLLCANVKTAEHELLFHPQLKVQVTFKAPSESVQLIYRYMPTVQLLLLPVLQQKVADHKQTHTESSIIYEPRSISVLISLTQWRKIN